MWLPKRGPRTPTPNKSLRSGLRLQKNQVQVGDFSSLAEAHGIFSCCLFGWNWPDFLHMGRHEDDKTLWFIGEHHCLQKAKKQCGSNEKRSGACQLCINLSIYSIFLCLMCVDPHQISYYTSICRANPYPLYLYTYITLQYITLHCIAWYTLHCITLHT